MSQDLAASASHEEPEQDFRVTLVFKTERAQQVFLHHLRSVVEGKSFNPTLSLVLDQLKEPLEGTPRADDR